MTLIGSEIEFQNIFVVKKFQKLFSILILQIFRGKRKYCRLRSILKFTN